jgi:hypothetical protein
VAAPAAPEAPLAATAVTEIAELAQTDPAAAAARFEEAVRANTAAEYRDALVSGSLDSIETIGTNAAVDGRAMSPAVESLSRAYEGLRAGGQADLATSVAESFGRGVVDPAVDVNPVASHTIQSAVSSSVAAGHGAQFAADATMAMMDRVSNGRMGQDYSITADTTIDNATKGFASGLRALEGRVAGDIAELSQDRAHIAEVSRGMVDHFGPAETARVEAEMLASRADLIQRTEQGAGQLFDALDAGARLAVAENNPNGALARDVARAASKMDDIANTVTGKASIASALERQMAGQTTVFDNLRAMPQDLMTRQTRREIFNGIAQGASVLGMQAAQNGQPERITGLANVLEHNAGMYLDRRGRNLVGQVAEGLRSQGGLSADAARSLATALQDRAGAVGGNAAAANLGALAGLGAVDPANYGLSGTIGEIGNVSNALSGIFDARSMPNAGSILAAAGAASAIGSFFTGDMKDVGNVIGGISALNDTVAFGARMAGNSALSSALGNSGRFLGSLGAAYNLGNALYMGDGGAALSSGAALAAAASGNPYLGLAVAGLQLGGAAVNAISDNIHRGRIEQEFLQNALPASGLTPEGQMFSQVNGNLDAMFAELATGRAQAQGIPQHQAYQELMNILAARDAETLRAQYPDNYFRREMESLFIRR